MRLPASKVYRAFPELDRFSDEQCEHFLVAARRGRRQRVGRFVLQLLALLIALAVGAGAYWGLTRVTVLNPTRIGSGTIADVVFGIALVLELGAGGLAWLLAKDRLLRGRIRRVLNTRGSCAACGYVLAGLPVSADGHVTCPECGYRLLADGSLGEIAPDATGANRFLPSPDVVPAFERWLTPRRVRVIKRLAIGVPASIVLLVLVAWGGYEWFLHRQAAEARAARTGFRELAALMEGRQPAGAGTSSPDAWDSFGRAALLMARTDIEVTRKGAFEYPPTLRPEYTFGFVYSDPDAWLDPNVGMSREQLRRFAIDLIEAYRGAGVPEAFNEMAGCKRASRRLVDPGPAAPMVQTQFTPELQSVWVISTMNAARMHLALEHKDREEFAAALEANLALVRMLRQGVAFMDRSLASPVLNTTLARVRECLATRPDVTWVAAIDSAIERQRIDVPFASVLESERLMALDTIDWVFSDADRARWDRYSTALNAFLSQWGITPHALLGTYRQNRDAITARFDEAILRAAAEPFQRPPASGLQSSNLLLVNTFWATVWMMPESADREMLLERSLVLLVALEKHRCENGEYPERLLSLVPPLSPLALRDPWSGSEFRYRRVPARGGAAPTFLLYSIGADGVDNGGTPAANDYSALWSGAAGVDYVISPITPSPAPK